MNEEESRDRKQSGTERKGRRIKMRREGIGKRKGKRERRGDEEDETRGDCAKRRSFSRCLSREQKKRRGPRSVLPVRIPTGSLAIQTRKRREQGRRKIKGSIFPSKREYPRRAKSRASKWFQRHLYALLILPRRKII